MCVVCVWCVCVCVFVCVCVCVFVCLHRRCLVLCAASSTRSSVFARVCSRVCVWIKIIKGNLLSVKCLDAGVKPVVKGSLRYENIIMILASQCPSMFTR